MLQTLKKNRNLNADSVIQHILQNENWEVTFCKGSMQGIERLMWVEILRLSTHPGMGHHGV